MRFEARLSGTGGQGLILAGIILAEAAISDGFHAVQTQSYGPEARGGASRSEVIISDEPIDYPKVTAPNVVLAMSGEAFEKYGKGASPEAVVVVDSSLVDPEDLPGRALCWVPITTTAVEVTGRTVTANVVAVGFIAAMTAVVSKDALSKAVHRHVPPRTRDVNEAALAAGWKMGSQYRGQ